MLCLYIDERQTFWGEISDFISSYKVLSKSLNKWVTIAVKLWSQVSHEICIFAFAFVVFKTECSRLFPTPSRIEVLNRQNFVIGFQRYRLNTAVIVKCIILLVSVSQITFLKCIFRSSIVVFLCKIT